MNRRQLEDRLQADAEHIRAACPERVGHRVSAQIRSREERPLPWMRRMPAIAGAAAAVVLSAVLWLAGQPGDSDRPQLGDIALNAVPVVATSDRLMASREAALANERQLLERDLRNLREQLTSTFLQDTNG